MLNHQPQLQLASPAPSQAHRDNNVQANTIQQARRPTPANAITPIEAAVQICQSIYDQEFIKSLHKLTVDFENHRVKNSSDVWFSADDPTRHEPRIKRQLASVLAGIFACNFFNTIEEKIFGHQETTFEQRSKLMEHNLLELNKRQELSALIDTHLIESIKSLSTLTLETASKLNQVIHLYPQIGLIGAKIIAKIQAKQQLIDTLRFTIPTGKVDVVNLAQILDSTAYSRLDSEFTYIHEIETPSPNVLRLTFSGRLRSQDTFVYRADAIDVWANLTETPTLFSYDGERYLIKNFTSNCVKPIKQPSLPFISESCTKQNWVDKRLKSWVKKRSSEDVTKDVSISTYKEAWPFNVVYCFGHNVTVNQDTFRCPTYPFAVNATFRFDTSDNVISPNITYHQQEDVILSLELPVIQLDGTPIELEDYDLVKTITQLRRDNKEAEEKLTIAFVGENQFTWKHATWMSLGASTIIIPLFVLSWCHYNIRNKHTTHKILRTIVDQSRGEGVYDFERRNSLPRSFRWSRFTKQRQSLPDGLPMARLDINVRQAER